MSDRGSQSKKTRANAERGTHVPRQPEGSQRRVSRAEREAKRQKQLRWGVAIAAVAVLAVLIGFATWDYVIKPRQVLATVDGTRIRREDYWKYRRLELYQQISQYSQYSQMVQDQNQAQQYQSLALQAQSQFESVWGSTNVNDSTLQQMIDNEIYVQSLDDFGITISDQDLETWTLNQFAPFDAPLIEPTVTPTFVPERAEWATQTAEALTPTIEITPSVEGAASTPIGGATPIVDGTPIASASPITESTPAASPATSPMASPDAGTGAVASPEASPMASPEATVEPTPTLSQDQALATAEAGWDSYQTVLDQARMSTSDYYRLSARPLLAQQKIRDTLTADIGQTADQVHARHILVATEELAQQLYADITSGTQDFATVATTSSTDTSTAPNGGDLGWFPRGVMVDSFEEVAFSTPAGTVAPPVQSEFGWHIIEVVETQSGRALTDAQISQLQQSSVQDWLENRRQEVSISSVMEPTPTPATANFVPPVGAPPLPTPTAIPAETVPLMASPVVPEASPLVDGDGTPAAVLVASPIAADATPEATPMTATESSPIASQVVPAASPAADIGGTPVTNLVATPEPSAASPEATPMTATESTPIASPVVDIASPVVPASVASASPVVDATPMGTAIGGIASPEAATPAVVPINTAQSTPLASPVASPAATPAASPIATQTTAAVAVVPGTTPGAIVTAATPAPAVPTVCATVSASPEASPIASPMASPVASPVASPFATPVDCAA